jgi:hypothetical protein
MDVELTAVNSTCWKRPASKRVPAFFVIVVLCWIGAPTPGAFSRDTLRKSWPPTGNSVRLPVTRDTWVSSVGTEKNGNNGGASRLKVKGQQEYALIDIDTASLKGKIVTGALLHLRSASPDKAPLARLGASSVATEWTEGSSFGYRPQVGASCFEQASYQLENWAYSGSSLMDAVFGRGHTVWKFAECSPPDQDAWQVCAVAPDVVAARVAGISHGFCLYDEVGSIWSINKGKFDYTNFPNRYFYSRESGGSAPWIEVWTDGTDVIPPDPITAISVATKGLPGGEAILEWKSPLDKGGGSTIGFYGEYTSGGQPKPIPRYLIPMAMEAGQTIRMHLQGLSLKPGQEIIVTIRPVDSAGNIGTPYSQGIQVSSGARLPETIDTIEPIFKINSELKKIGGVQVSVVDLLDKINPQTGITLPRKKAEDRESNYLFSATENKIRLYAARNEAVCFQLNLEGSAEKISIDFGFDHHPTIKTQLYQFGYVNVKDSQTGKATLLPDPLLPIEGGVSVPSVAGKVPVADQRNHSLVCELYVPHDEAPGKKEGAVRIKIGPETLDFPIELTIWDFTLPDKLSFIPEMNAYGTVSPFSGYDYYRLAHDHRCCINRLPYGWDGTPAFAPEWKGNQYDWEKWDRFVGPLLDGSAFKASRRKSEPVDVLYLPFNENWPVSLFDDYSPSYWPEDAFTDAYRRNLQHAFSAFADHCSEKRWQDTVFQFYLNNKVYNRRQSQLSSAPWIFDEPINTQDFWALRWYGLLWQTAVQPYRNKVKLWYRGDISYSQFGRNILWGIMDVQYLGGNNDQKTRMKHDEQVLYGNTGFAEYGTANKIDTPNTQPVLWCLSAWANGAMGVLPWQTIGGENAWINGEETALFYPRSDGPVPSVRLKAFMVGQQLVEYLVLFCQTYHLPQYALAHWVKDFLCLKGDVKKNSDADAGTLQVRGVDMLDLWQMRYKLGEMISKKAPLYKRALVEFESMAFNAGSLPNIGYVFPAPEVDSLRPKCDRFRPN